MVPDKKREKRKAIVNIIFIGLFYRLWLYQPSSGNSGIGLSVSGTYAHLRIFLWAGSKKQFQWVLHLIWAPRKRNARFIVRCIIWCHQRNDVDFRPVYLSVRWLNPTCTRIFARDSALPSPRTPFIWSGNNSTNIEWVAYSGREAQLLLLLEVCCVTEVSLFPTERGWVEMWEILLMGKRVSSVRFYWHLPIWEALIELRWVSV